MSLNQYNVYSMISQLEKANNQEIEKINEILKKLDTMHKINDVREFLKNTFDLSGNVHDYPCGKDGFINIEDSASLLIVNIVFKDENIMYCYNRRSE